MAVGGSKLPNLLRLTAGQAPRMSATWPVSRTRFVLYLVREFRSATDVGAPHSETTSWLLTKPVRVWNDLAVGKSRCACGAIVLWKADEPESDEWLLARKAELPDDLAELNDPKQNYRLTTDAAFCSNCGRLWIWWRDARCPAEYVPADPAVRPVRRRPPSAPDRSAAS